LEKEKERKKERKKEESREGRKGGREDERRRATQIKRKIKGKKDETQKRGLRTCCEPQTVLPVTFHVYDLLGIKPILLVGFLLGC
jgi:hypothetical protein